MGADGGRKRVDDSRQTPPGPLPIERAALLTRRDAEYTMPAADRSRWAQARARALGPCRGHDARAGGVVARGCVHRSPGIVRPALRALSRIAPRDAAPTDRSVDAGG